jgi:hypothetical protein
MKRNLLWIAVSTTSIHVMEHEGDYEDKDTLIAINPSVGGPEIRIVVPQKD